MTRASGTAQVAGDPKAYSFALGTAAYAVEAVYSHAGLPTLLSASASGPMTGFFGAENAMTLSEAHGAAVRLLWVRS